MTITSVVDRVLVRPLASSRQNRLELISIKRTAPRLMTPQELVQFAVESDRNTVEFHLYLREGLSKDYTSQEEFMEECFDNTYYGLCEKNTIDEISIQLSRGDYLLSLSSHKLMHEGIGFDSDWDCNTTIVCAEGTCVAVISTSWVGGDGTSNLFVDFRYDSPKIYKLKAWHNTSCIDAIAISEHGEILFRDWWKRLGILNDRQCDIEPIIDKFTFERARRLFELHPRNAEMATWIFPWPFKEVNWYSLSESSI